MEPISSTKKALLVGDNPFHNISHLSQDRIKDRGKSISSPDYAAQLIVSSVENGANGFMFSVSRTTLSILASLRKNGQVSKLDLYPIMPYAFEYVQLATQVGGLSGLAKNVGKQVLLSRDLSTVANGLKAVLRMDPVSFMKAYLSYETSRIRSVIGKGLQIKALVLHEVITDMVLALRMDWFFSAYVDYVSKVGFTPGFNTCNFAYLVDRLKEWNIDVSQTIIAAPFNKMGFQMCPSRIDCESALATLSGPALIAISILAAGYIKPVDAISYLATLPNVKGAAVGVSKDKQAVETFRILREKLT